MMNEAAFLKSQLSNHSIMNFFLADSDMTVHLPLVIEMAHEKKFTIA